MAQFFNKAYLERIQSPEQLDTPQKITSPLSWLALAAATVLIAVGLSWALFWGKIPVTVEPKGLITSPEGCIGIYAPEGGTAEKVAPKGAQIGRDAENNNVLNYLYGANQKKTLEINSRWNGVISQAVVQNNAEFRKGAELFRITPELQHHNSLGAVVDRVLICYAKAEDLNKIKVGQQVKVELNLENSSRSGDLTATVIHIEDVATTNSGFKSVGVDIENATNPYMVNDKSGATAPVYAVICELKTDEKTASGFACLNDKLRNLGYGDNSLDGPFDGQVKKAVIVIKTQRPVEKFIEGFTEKVINGKRG